MEVWVNWITTGKTVSSNIPQSTLRINGGSEIDGVVAYCSDDGELTAFSVDKGSYVPPSKIKLNRILPFGLSTCRESVSLSLEFVFAFGLLAKIEPSDESELSCSTDAHIVSVSTSEATIGDGRSG